MADLRNTRLSVYLRNRLLDGHGLADFDGALIRVYSAAQPATPETAIGAQVKIVTLTMNATGFPAASAAAGVATANPITSGNTIAAGTVTWFRIVDSTGTNVLVDGSVGPSGDGNIYNLTLAAVALLVGVSIGASSLTLTLPMQGT
jgi:hypothetical protein